MDLTPIVLGIAAINVGVFIAGSALAAYRTWRETVIRRRAQARARTIGTRRDLGVPPVGHATH